MICMKTVITIALLSILWGTIDATNRGLGNDCTNITIVTSEFLSHANAVVDVNGTCVRTEGDSSGGVLTYGHASKILAECSGEVTGNTIIFNFRFYYNNTLVFEPQTQTYQMQCDVSLKLVNSTWDHSLEPYIRTTGQAAANGTISKTLVSMNISKTQYNLGDFVVVEILSTSTMSGLKIRPQRCWASPTSQSVTSYDLLNSSPISPVFITENIILVEITDDDEDDSRSCPADPTTSVTVNADLKSTLKFEAFIFLSSPNSIFLECDVLLCLDSTVDSRCNPCLSKRRRRGIEKEDTSGYHRVRSNSFLVIPQLQRLKKESRKIVYKHHMKLPCHQIAQDEFKDIVIGLLLTSLIMFILLVSSKRFF